MYAFIELIHMKYTKYKIHVTSSQARKQCDHPESAHVLQIGICAVDHERKNAEEHAGHGQRRKRLAYLVGRWIKTNAKYGLYNEDVQFYASERR